MYTLSTQGTRHAVLQRDTLNIQVILWSHVILEDYFVILRIFNNLWVRDIISTFRAKATFSILIKRNAKYADTLTT